MTFTEQTHFSFEQLPEAKRGPARSALRRAAKASLEPYSLAVERLAAQTALMGVIQRDPVAVRAGFARGDTISNLLHRHASREIPGFDIRGAIIATPADFAAFNLAVRSPFFESVKVAVLGEGSQVVHSQIIHVGTVNETVFSALTIGLAWSSQVFVRARRSAASWSRTTIRPAILRRPKRTAGPPSSSRRSVTRSECR